MAIERVTRPAYKAQQPDRRKGRPSSAQAAYIHDHILDTAWTLFMQRGCDAVTVSDIARQGNLSKRTIYDRFQNKDALFVAVLESRIIRWTRDLARPIPNVDFRGWLRTYAERMLRLTMNDEHVALERLTDAESSRFPYILGIITPGYLSALDILTAGVSAEATRLGREPQHDILTTRCWFDMLVGHARSGYRMSLAGFDLDTHLAEWLDRLVDLFLVMLNGQVDVCEERRA